MTSETMTMIGIQDIMKTPFIMMIGEFHTHHETTKGVMKLEVTQTQQILIIEMAGITKHAKALRNLLMMMALTTDYNKEYEFEKLMNKMKKLVDSGFLKNMFSSPFREKEAKEIELGIVKPQAFQLFLDFTNGVISVTDENIEEAMSVVDYLQVPKLEIHCLEHLSQRSELTLNDQFTLAENSHSEKLVRQIMNSINDSFVFNEVVPADLDSLSNNAKSIVLQKAFELLGHRKPSPPPMEHEETFEQRVNEILDQLEIQNHEGEVLADQCRLLRTHVTLEQFMSLKQLDRIGLGEINNDAEIRKLKDQRHSADALERNYFEAQIQVAKWKHLYTKIDNADLEANTFDKETALTLIIKILFLLPPIIDRSKRNNVGALELAVGNHPIDEIYRNDVARIENPQIVPNLENVPKWMKSIEYSSPSIQIGQWENVRFPDGIRQVSADANFTILDNFIRDIRNMYYDGLAQAEQQNENQN
ncbi:hypothetical protein CAEBREN_09940 [Caenorhabditis brenneri]|uniref:BTB domain-containing protein n=1 Tax=Caenorhabditis brenneri TaxID=135651 RepID=G0NYA3_CAEBE|nr:hypothetical protein CAEBREN_09940 [Caenorhabditis brenneri]